MSSVSPLATGLGGRQYHCNELSHNDEPVHDYEPVHDDEPNVGNPRWTLNTRIAAGVFLFLASDLGAASPLGAQASGVSAPVTCPRAAGMVAPRLGKGQLATIDPSEYWTWSNGFERSNLGVGFLQAGPSDSSRDAADWLPHIRLPLFGRPNEPEPYIWISDGFWLPVSDGSKRRPLTYRGMVETGYEIPSFVVVDAREDGWIQLHLDTGPLDVRGVSWGYVWTHTCFLEDGDVPLRFVRWEDWFRTSNSGVGMAGVTFRDGSRHALRAGPGTEHRRARWVEGDDELEFLEFRDDWARVRISRPGRYLTGCMGEDWKGEEFEGWVKWRDAESGPWVWYPTRGC